MADILKAGEEWFHKTELFRLRVGFSTEARPRDGHWTYECRVGDSSGPGCFLRGDDILRDYTRNEPVTLELLGRMGWDVSRYSAGSATLELTKKLTAAENGYNGMSLIWRPEDQPPRGFHLNLSLVRWECSAIACEKPLAAVHTLRDVLNVLRVFGVKDPVTPAATETEPTAKA